MHYSTGRFSALVLVCLVAMVGRVASADESAVDLSKDLEKHAKLLSAVSLKANPTEIFKGGLWSPHVDYSTFLIPGPYISVGPGKDGPYTQSQTLYYFDRSTGEFAKFKINPFAMKDHESTNVRISSPSGDPAQTFEIFLWSVGHHPTQVVYSTTPVIGAPAAGTIEVKGEKCSKTEVLDAFRNEIAQAIEGSPLAPVSYTPSLYLMRRIREIISERDVSAAVKEKSIRKAIASANEELELITQATKELAERKYARLHFDKALDQLEVEQHLIERLTQSFAPTVIPSFQTRGERAHSDLFTHSGSSR